MDLSLLLERTLPPLGYELVDVETTPKGRLIRVFIDKPEGVDVEDCARVSQHLTRLFAVENVDFDRLEVSSPGLDRPLKKPDDFVRFAGQEAELRIAAPEAGRRAQAQGCRQGLHRRGRADRDGGGRAGRSPSPTSTARASCRRSSGDEHEQFEPGNPAAGGCAGAREERGQGDRVRRPRVGARVRDEEALSQRGDRRARVDRPRDRRLRFVPPLDRRARRGARGAVAPAGDHRRDRARPRPQARRRHRGTARADRVRPHRRAGGQAGDPAEDPRRRARADPERLPRAPGQPADRAPSSASSAATSSSSPGASRA